MKFENSPPEQHTDLNPPCTIVKIEEHLPHNQLVPFSMQSDSAKNPAILYAQKSALIFPPAGTHWPGMGSEFVQSPSALELLEKAEEALYSIGIPYGSLTELMRGKNQAVRLGGPDAWAWQGDFPLSVAAQTVVGAILAQAFIKTIGTPGALAGQSMGENAALCVSGALSIKEAVLLAYRWAHAYKEASDHLGLRMAVVELKEDQPFFNVKTAFEAEVVIHHTPTLLVVALPWKNLSAFEAEVVKQGGRVLVSRNPIAAHDGRLKKAKSIWKKHTQFLETLHIKPPRIQLLSTLAPGKSLMSVQSIRTNLYNSSFMPVLWGHTLSNLPALHISNILQVGLSTSRPYALEKLRKEEPKLDGIKIKAIKSLDGIEKLYRRVCGD